MAAPSLSKNGRGIAIFLNKALYWFSRRWLLAITIILIVFNGLPFLAPIFMEQGWEKAGNANYFIYSVLCRQMPQRSLWGFLLFLLPMAVDGTTHILQKPQTKYP